MNINIIINNYNNNNIIIKNIIILSKNYLYLSLVNICL